MNRKASFYLLILWATVTSCSKKLSTTDTRDVEGAKLEVNDVDFDYFTIKSKISLVDQEKKQNATSLIRMKKDSIIWFNLSGALGIQGLRGILTVDSVKIINRVEKTYSRWTYKELSEQLNFDVDFQIIQSMVVGNMPRGNELPGNLEKVENSYVLKQNTSDLHITNYVNINSLKVEKVDLREANSENMLTMTYKDFQLVDEQFFPFFCNFSLNYRGNNKNVITDLAINHNKVEFSEKPLKFPFNVPNKYERN